jgi:hypothetical protein
MNEGETKQKDPEKDPEIDPCEKQERIVVVTEEIFQEFHLINLISSTYQ